ncbi:hypothetical protein THASP1DRAFT_28453 [Thamnocephalis sphaerospora]|uniref:F-box domain-containing protein n=1 Tax=Thamnocephalis sphaerospora TaxID=78915 RepID=A0A4P9XU79_9FUNG|nr:hypothetical protein THASP1DRAFT_28453 [Thamnocephalis sphaerospora]|eukprot:RKP09768.1 hypothetical protein THASP1DRAFT_28453 [Thamnocephalis sphaerospora]
MEHIPNEVLDQLMEASSDDISLVALARTSKQWRNRVSCRQQWWRRRFEQQFSQHDSKERAWLRQYERAYGVAAIVGNPVGEASNLHSSVSLDWFDVYCKRRAVEYRWRHGQYLVHAFTDIADTRPCGARLQSIPFVRNRLFGDDVVVASQWLLDSRQHTTWLLERLYWGDIDVKRIEVSEKLWQSDEYLVAQAKNKSTKHYSLYVWHFAALHEPPRTIVEGTQSIRSIDVHKDWLACQYRLPSMTDQDITFVYNLINGTHCIDTQSGFSRCCIQRTTADSVYLARTESSWHNSGFNTCELWQVTPSRAASFQLQTAAKIRVNVANGCPQPQRIDDNRVIVWSKLQAYR